MKVEIKDTATEKEVAKGLAALGFTEDEEEDANDNGEGDEGGNGEGDGDNLNNDTDTDKDGDDNANNNDSPEDSVLDIIGKTFLGETFSDAVKDLEIADPNSIEDVNKFIGEKLVPIAKQTGVQEYLEKNPVLAKINEHLSRGYSLETFIEAQKPTTYDKLKVEENNAEVIYREGLKAKGVNDKVITRTIEAAKDEGTLLDEAKEELKFLQTLEKKNKEAIIANEAARIKAEQDAELALWQEAQTKAKAGKFAGVALPPEDINPFYTALTSRGTTGKEPTQLEKFYENISVEEQLFLDYMLYNLKTGGISKRLPKLVTADKKVPQFNRKPLMGQHRDEGGNDSTMTISEFNSKFNRKK
jgi:hypothetical protein